MLNPRAGQLNATLAERFEEERSALLPLSVQEFEVLFEDRLITEHLRHCGPEKFAMRAAVESLDHLAYLLQLCELELIERERRAPERRLKAARFPATKTLDEFDFRQQPLLNKLLVLELAQRQYAGQHPPLL